jgi:hypothetical protein
MTKKGAFTSSKMAHPLITLEKCASTSAPISQVSGLAERRRQHNHLVPRTLHTRIFSYGNSLQIECSYHLFLQMSLSSELELLLQLQKWRQRCYVAYVMTVQNTVHVFWINVCKLSKL